MNETDVVIIGAGHNGLTCAAYLAMAGLRVKLVEPGYGPGTTSWSSTAFTRSTAKALCNKVKAASLLLVLMCTKAFLFFKACSSFSGP